MGAVTFTPARDAAGKSPYGVTVEGKRFVEGTLVFSGSYATGGDSLALGPTTLRSLDRVDQIGSNNGGLSVVVAGTPTAPLLQAWGSSVAGAAAQIANGVVLTARQPLRVRLVGNG